MSTQLRKCYDLVIYGASGFTGQFVIEEVARVHTMEREKGLDLTWAVAGRNADKLKAVLEESGKIIGKNLDDIPIITANNNDVKSIEDMAKQAKVVINCVGPYDIYGETVVKACIQNGASHVDISGEPQFLERMQLVYDEEAEQAGVHIVGACGYDSIPADVGLSYMAKQFPGELNSAECIVSILRGHRSSIHTGTMESAAGIVQKKSEIGRLRSQLYPEKLPKPTFKQERRPIIHKNEELGMWCVPLPSDEPMVYRTQRFRHDKKSLRPIQFHGYVACRNLFEASALLIAFIYFLAMSYFDFTRKLLFKYPKLMTAGVFSSEGPSRESLQDVEFTSTIIGSGWSQKKADDASEYTSPPDTKVVLKIQGGDPGYGATSLMMVASAMTILREKNSLEKRGGVMGPGTAFMNTSIMDRLRARGMTVRLESGVPK